MSSTHDKLTAYDATPPPNFRIRETRWQSQGQRGKHQWQGPTGRRLIKKQEVTHREAGTGHWHTAGVAAGEELADNTRSPEQKRGHRDYVGQRMVWTRCPPGKEGPQGAQLGGHLGAQRSWEEDPEPEGRESYHYNKNFHTDDVRATRNNSPGGEGDAHPVKSWLSGTPQKILAQSLHLASPKKKQTQGLMLRLFALVTSPIRKKKLSHRPKSSYRIFPSWKSSNNLFVKIMPSIRWGRAIVGKESPKSNRINSPISAIVGTSAGQGEKGPRVPGALKPQITRSCSETFLMFFFLEALQQPNKECTVSRPCRQPGSHSACVWRRRCHVSWTSSAAYKSQ